MHKMVNNPESRSERLKKCIKIKQSHDCNATTKSVKTSEAQKIFNLIQRQTIKSQNMKTNSKANNQIEDPAPRQIIRSTDKISDPQTDNLIDKEERVMQRRIERTFVPKTDNTIQGSRTQDDYQV